MKKQNNGKLSGPEVVRAEYLKLMNSPNYRKKIKRSVTMLKVYSKICNRALTQSHIVKAAKYFAEDIRTSNSKSQPEQNQAQDDVILPTKPVKI